MNEHDRISTNHPGNPATAPLEERKPYHKPSFRFEQVFETLALQCGKMAGTSGACNMVKIAS